MKKKHKKRFGWQADVDAEPGFLTSEDDELDEDSEEDACDCEEDEDPDAGNVVISAIDSIRETQRVGDYLERRLHLEGLIGSTSGSNNARSNASKLAEDIIRFNWADDDAEAEFRKSHPSDPPPKRTPIKLFIDTAGGSLHDTMHLVEVIQKSRTPVWTIAEGLCASGGFYVFIAGERRICSEYTTFLTHEGFLMRDYNDSFDALIRMAEHFAKFQRHKVQPFVRSRIKTEIGLRAYKKRLHSEWYFTADKAIRYGIADEIIKDFTILR